VYLSWLKPKLTGAPEESEIHYIEQALAHIDGRDAKPLKYRDIIKALRKIQTFTERL
jgi:DNA-directed RNA polymerase delta subunit